MIETTHRKQSGEPWRDNIGAQCRLSEGWIFIILSEKDVKSRECHFNRYKRLTKPQ